jgi:hypothetical protein
MLKSLLLQTDFGEQAMKLRKPLEYQLRKWPRLYEFSAVVYSTLQPVHLKEHFIGTKAHEKWWARRHLSKNKDWNLIRHPDGDDDWVSGYWDSREHSHRYFLMERISEYCPFSSLLEVGCNCGPNLYLLAKKYPYVNLSGVDINPKAIEKGREFLRAEDISNTRLSVARADDLSQFPDRSFDVTFTNSLLMYIGPDKIVRVVTEMLRVTRYALVLLERHCFQPHRGDHDGLGVYRHNSWERDYVSLLSQFVPQERITVTGIPKGVWPDSQRWQETGAVIEAVVRQDK